MTDTIEFLEHVTPLLVAVAVLAVVVKVVFAVIRIERNTRR